MDPQGRETPNGKDKPHLQKSQIYNDQNFASDLAEKLSQLNNIDKLCMRDI